MKPALPNLLAALLFVAACSKDEPTKPKPPAPPTVPAGTIAFRSPQDGEIYTVSTDGANLRKLTSSGSAAGNHRWLPDGSKLLFDAPGGLWVVNADGTGLTNLSADGGGVVSPDGTRIAYAHQNAYAYSDVWVMNVDGTGATNLTQNSDLTGSWEPTWSPDGTRIAFRSVRRTSPTDLPGTFSIERMNTDGSGRTILTAGKDDLPIWSGDGAQIAYLTNRFSDPYVYLLYAINADGTGEHAVYPYQVTTESLRRAPDGRLVFESGYSPSGTFGTYATYLAKADGTNLARLTTELVGAMHPSWSRDGLYCAVETGASIHVLKKDGAAVAEVPNTFQGEDPAWRPGN